MALKKTYCQNHSERPAIGVCVMTGQAICEECSTQYEGVNYSHEGLRLLQAQRQAKQKLQWWPDKVLLMLGLLVSPLALLLLYWGVEALVYVVGLRA